MISYTEYPKGKLDRYGKFVQTEDMVLPFTDMSFKRGWGSIFTSGLGLNGQLFRLDDHLDRLENSIALSGVKVQTKWRKRLDAIIWHTLMENSLSRLSKELLSVQIYGLPGQANRNLISQKSNLTWHVVVNLFHPPKDPISVITTRVERNKPSLKSTDYRAACEAYLVANSSVDDIIYVSKKPAFIKEGSTFAIVVIMPGDQIHTPPVGVGILPSITIKVLKKVVFPMMGLQLNERCITLDEVLGDATAVLAVSTSGIRNVRKIDEHVIGTGRQNVVSRQIKAVYWQHVLHQFWTQ